MYHFHEPTAVRYAIYARKSQEDKSRQVQSIEDQTNYAKQRANERGLNVVAVIHDEKTGTKPNVREGFTRMIQLIHEGKVDGIICWKIDRLARNPIDEGVIKWAFQMGMIKHLVASDREFREGDSQILLGIDFSAATQYSIDLSRNVKRGLASKIEKGHWTGYARFGYLNCGNKQGEKWIGKDTERWELVQRCWEYFATGIYSVPQIREMSYEWGLYARPTKRTPERQMISLNAYYQMFRDQFYMGKMEIKGKLYDGAHPPMVSPDMFYRVQEVLRKRGNHHYVKPQSKEFSIAGRILCGQCGCSIVCEDKIKYRCSHCKKYHTASNSVPTHCPSCRKIMAEETFVKAKYHAYAHCTGRNAKRKACYQSYYSTGKGKASIPIAELEKQIDEKLASIEYDDDVHEYCMELLQDSVFQGLITDQVNADKTAEKEYSAATHELERLVEMKYKDQIDDVMFEKKKNELELKKADAKARIPDNTRQNPQWFAQTEKMLEMAFKARKIFKTGTICDKREILEAVCSHIFLQEGKLTFKFAKPYDVLITEKVEPIPNELYIKTNKQELAIWLP